MSKNSVLSTIFVFILFSSTNWFRRFSSRIYGKHVKVKNIIYRGSGTVYGHFIFSFKSQTICSL
jgi:hypothetical protein